MFLFSVFFALNEVEFMCELLIIKRIAPGWGSSYWILFLSRMARGQFEYFTRQQRMREATKVP